MEKKCSYCEFVKPKRQEITRPTFCSRCGSEQKVEVTRESFCGKCGKELFSLTSICPSSLEKKWWSRFSSQINMHDREYIGKVTKEVLEVLDEHSKE